MLFGFKKSIASRIGSILLLSLAVTLVPLCFWPWIAGALGIRWQSGTDSLPLWFGVIGGVLILFECALWARKRILRISRWFGGGQRVPKPGSPKRRRHWTVPVARLFRSAKSWMWLHLVVGFALIPMVLIHTGFHFWSGPLATWTLWLFFAVSVSGILGLIVQQFLPRRLLDEVTGETVESEIEKVAGRQLLEVEALVRYLTGITTEKPEWETVPSGVEVVPLQAGSAVSVRLQKLYNEEILPFYLPKKYPPKTRTSRRQMALASRQNCRVLFEHLLREVPESAQEAIRAIERYCHERREMDRQWRLNFVLHKWLIVHSYASGALLILVFWHGATAWKWWRFFE